MPMKGQFTVTLSGEPAHRLLKAHKNAQVEFHKLFPNIDLSLAAFICDMALQEAGRRGYIEKTNGRKHRMRSGRRPT